MGIGIIKLLLHGIRQHSNGLPDGRMECANPKLPLSKIKCGTCNSDFWIVSNQQRLNKHPQINISVESLRRGRGEQSSRQAIYNLVKFEYIVSRWKRIMAFQRTQFSRPSIPIHQAPTLFRSDSSSINNYQQSKRMGTCTCLPTDCYPV